MAGTETRQRDKLFQIRVSADELVAIGEAADRRGLSPASYARERLLGHEPPRAVRRPPLDRVLVSQLLATLGPIGGELRRLSERFQDPALSVPDRARIDKAFDEISTMRDALMLALRREP
jgi:hypothetical protein